ncbi:MAG: hypothetical protein DMG65_19165 [Candidatus Angelobacter sp. Gp1-AA117]|nr:MAG: hypothetical protein DMG65_19165 [Candidatus Angelobacter sp. Gp1-AA117]
MSTGVVREIINWLSLPLLGILAGILVRRKIPRIYPAFFVYIVAEFLSGTIRWVVYYSSGRTGVTRVYAITYWTTDIVITMLALLVVYELFLKQIFFQFRRIRFYRYLFPVAALVIIVLAGLNATNNIKLTLLLKSLHIIDFVRAATIFFFIALMLFMGRRWKKFEFAIALGMAIDACTFLAVYVIPMSPANVHSLAHTLPVIGYDVACIVWLVYFAKAEKQMEAPLIEPVTPELVQGAQQTEENLKDWLAGKKSR